MKVYVVCAAVVYDGCEDWDDMKVYARKEDAFFHLHEVKKSLKKDYVEDGGWVCEESEHSISVYLDGDYAYSHGSAYMRELEVE